MPVLVLIDPSGRRKAYNLREEKVFLGRSAENQIPVNDQKSSRRHCVVEPTPDGRWRLRDLGSTNGTVVNGLPADTRLLEDGDVIAIGLTEILFRDEDFAAQARSSPTRRIEPLKEPQQDAEPRRRRRDPERPADLARENAGLRRVLDVTRRLNTESSLESLLNLIVDTAIDLTSAERGFLILLDDGSMSFRVARTSGRADIEHPEMQISHHVTSEVLQSRRTVISADAQEDERFQSAKSVKNLNLRSVLCTPLHSKANLAGALYIDNTYEKGVFAEEDIEILEAFSAHAAVALENARNLAALESNHLELSQSLKTIEILNRELKDHVDKQTRELETVKEELQESRGHLSLKYDYGNIIGRSPKMQEIFRILDRITDVNVPVLIQGSSGTGKELIARSIHFNGPRASKAFVSENCAAVAETLLESELFGYVRGAFTGAQRDKKGLFEMATEGTLFLDEIGDMSPDMQKKILRVIQEGEIRPVGGKDKIKIDVRLLSATNKDLSDLVRKGKFREDLFYRLNVVQIKIPQLRERREDIPVLAAHFLKNAIKENGCSQKTISERVMNALVAYDWPGNVRELENEIRRMVAMATGDIDDSVLSPDINASSHASAATVGPRNAMNLREVVEEVEKKMIVDTLRIVKWNKTKAAEMLGLSRLGLRKKIDRYRLEVVDDDAGK